MSGDGFFDAKLGDLFSSRRERGKPDLPTLSVLTDGGLQDRDSLDRKMDTNLSPEEHLLIRKNDIAYNMMRMWQGASGLAEADAIVSPAYVVLTPNQRIDPTFASYLFKSPRMIYLFWAYSHGLTNDRLRLYFDDFAQIPVRLPNLAAQRRIVEILATWDRTIANIRNLVENNQAQKKALMSEMLTGKTRLPAFSTLEWNFRKLGDLCIVKGEYGANAPSIPFSTEEPRYLRITDIDEYGELGGSDPRSVNKSSAGDKYLACGDLVFARSGATVGKTYLHCSEEELVFAGYLIRYRPDQSLVNPGYLAQFLKSEEYWGWVTTMIRAGAQPNINANEYASLIIPLPCLEEQVRIAEILRTIDDQHVNLGKQLRSLKFERQALLQQLLNGKRRVAVRELAA